jgi:hypothetical protein
MSKKQRGNAYISVTEKATFGITEKIIYVGTGAFENMKLSAIITIWKTFIMII